MKAAQRLQAARDAARVYEGVMGVAAPFLFSGEELDQLLALAREATLEEAEAALHALGKKQAARTVRRLAKPSVGTV